jgi:hypothetical protein
MEGYGGPAQPSPTRCVAKNEKKYKGFKPPLDKIPDAVKDNI